MEAVLVPLEEEVVVVVVVLVDELPLPQPAAISNAARIRLASQLDFLEIMNYSLLISHDRRALWRKYEARLYWVQISCGCDSFISWLW
jgi:hypothetical protein